MPRRAKVSNGERRLRLHVHRRPGEMLGAPRAAPPTRTCPTCERPHDRPDGVERCVSCELTAAMGSKP